jgi:hypothetical protein
MQAKQLLAALVIGASPMAFGAPAAYLTLDHSSDALIDKATTQAVWHEQLAGRLSKRLAKLYPPRKWGFVTQVAGGFNEGKTCIVTARVALVPRSGKSVVFTPRKMATAFDAMPNATPQQCKNLARAKLVEAIGAVESSLVTP